MELADISLKCADCGQDFIHTVADQERYQSRGFAHTPKRCPTCREARRQKTAAGKQAAGASEDNIGNILPARPTGPRPPRDFRPPPRGRMGQRDSARFGRGGGSGGGGGGDRGGMSRERHSAVCSACGKETQVPFKPIQGRPVYCRECYRARKGE
ncbi:hypothetical protein RAS1_41390 [Phycisphaerae bacterium RAS1]|nr:hypothetical protein RAS1_41390 [Phycisphaerae bacterium RAS1]